MTITTTTTTTTTKLNCQQTRHSHDTMDLVMTTAPSSSPPPFQFSPSLHLSCHPLLSLNKPQMILARHRLNGCVTGSAGKKLSCRKRRQHVPKQSSSRMHQQLHKKKSVKKPPANLRKHQHLARTSNEFAQVLAALVADI